MGLEKSLRSMHYMNIPRSCIPKTPARGRKSRMEKKVLIYGKGG